MAGFNIIIKCEHCGREFEYGKNGLRTHEVERYEAWARLNITTCPECRRKKAAKEKAAKESAIAAEVMEGLKANGVTLPELEGSEKQVKWAKQIRIEKIANNWQICGIAYNIIRGTLSQEYVEAAKQQASWKKIEKMIELLTTTSASEIIDLR